MLPAQGQVTLDIVGLRPCGQDGNLELVRLLQYEVREGREAGEAVIPPKALIANRNSSVILPMGGVDEWPKGE